jgi:hypothetical protein
MRTSRRLGLALALFGATLSATDCGGTQLNGQRDGGPQGDGCASAALPAPTNHRSTALACPTTRPPGINDDAGGGAPSDGGTAGPCTHDSQCTAGNNARCTPSEHNGFATCESDGCSSDGDCGTGNVCECGLPASTGRYPNVCLPGNCRIDSDCGCGYCSPTFGASCGAYGGVIGYYCHTAKDECTNDDQCTEGGPGYCGYQPTTNRWTCFYSFCAG